MRIHAVSFIAPLCAFIFSPLLMGLIVKTKALVAGRKGAPVLQLYYDLFKLVRKNVVYSTTTTTVFRIGPIIGLAVVFTASLMLPLGSFPPVVAFTGDIILFTYLFGILRFFLITGALDTGSAFEGMGASREAFYSLLAEPVLLIGLAALVRGSSHFTFAGIFNGSDLYGVIPTLLVGASFFVVMLAENSRIPVDDPTTHLELTMIHEVMVLDHSGPEFAAIQYTSSIKFWLFSSLFVQVLVPFDKFSGLTGSAILIGGIVITSVVVGVVESTMARLRLLKIPQLLIGAGALAILGLLFTVRGGVL